MLVVGLMLVAEFCMGSFKLRRKSSHPRTLLEEFAAADGVNNTRPHLRDFTVTKVGQVHGGAVLNTQMHTTRVQHTLEAWMIIIIRQPLYGSSLSSS